MILVARRRSPHPAVNPARAGMILGGRPQRGDRHRKPRASGDVADIKQDCIPELCQVEVAGSVV